MRPVLLTLVVTVFYLLHQDFWFKDQARPLIFGLLPVGLFYHVCYTVAVSFLMWVLIRYAWPANLEVEVDQYLRERKKSN